MNAATPACVFEIGFFRDVAFLLRDFAFAGTTRGSACTIGVSLFRGERRGLGTTVSEEFNDVEPEVAGVTVRVEEVVGVAEPELEPELEVDDPRGLLSFARRIARSGLSPASCWTKTLGVTVSTW